jgi:outer membrane lipoprotein-sorting protein
VRLAFQGPGKYRIQGSLPGLGLDSPEFEEATVVYDGSAVWFYLPKLNRYASIPASQLTADAPGDLGDLRPEAIDEFLLGRYRRAADAAGGSRFLRNETIEIGGAKAACYVLTVSPGGSAPYTWWVDQKRYRILREDHGDTSAVFTTIKLGEPLGDEVFRFVPPAGAKKLERPQF